MADYIELINKIIKILDVGLEGLHALSTGLENKNVEEAEVLVGDIFQIVKSVEEAMAVCDRFPNTAPETIDFRHLQDLLHRLSSAIMEEKDNSALLLLKNDLIPAYKSLHNRIIEFSGAFLMDKGGENSNQQYIGEWTKLAEGLLQKGCDGEAKVYFQKVLGVDPDDAIASYRIAEILNREGDIQGSVEYHQRALQAQPPIQRLLFDRSNKVWGYNL